MICLTYLLVVACFAAMLTFSSPMLSIEHAAPEMMGKLARLRIKLRLLGFSVGSVGAAFMNRVALEPGYFLGDC